MYQDLLLDCDITNYRLKELAVVVSTGISKEFIGVELENYQLKYLSEKDVKKCYQMYQDFLLKYHRNNIEICEENPAQV